MIRGRPRIALFFLLLLLLSLPALGRSLEWTTVVKVIDGDTLVVDYKGKQQKVRLIGMDTPGVSYNWKTKSDMKKSGKDLEAITAQGKQASAFVQETCRKKANGSGWSLMYRDLAHLGRVTSPG